MKYYIIAGEASGDLHASNLIRELKKMDPAAEFRAWGGDLCVAQGASLVKHYRELAFMGFKEVIVNLRTIFANIKFCKEDIDNWKPDVIIFVDYPGFNLRIAKWAKENKFKTVYYISPQLWAWKEGRVRQIKANVDKMLVILPFEKDFYKKHNYEVDFVGHPLLDVVHDYNRNEMFIKENGLSGKPIVALLPGSRKQEISKMLPVMLEMLPRFPEYEFVIAGAPGQEEDFYKEFTQNYDVRLVRNRTYDLLDHATAALVTSGTATLETALFGVPEVVCYKGSAFSYAIAKRLVKVPYISLVNLVANREIVKELIQDDFNKNKLAFELNKLLNDPVYRNEMILGLKYLRDLLGGKGASKKAAVAIWEVVNE